MFAKHTLALLALSALPIAPTVAADTALLPGNATAGKKLHAANCVGCHDDKVYTRTPRRVNSVGGLVGQVEFCNQQLKKGLSKDQLNDLIAYLNEAYYKFE
jgi:mono/diheme cytochrome c family protein